MPMMMMMRSGGLVTAVTVEENLPWYRGGCTGSHKNLPINKQCKTSNDEGMIMRMVVMMMIRVMVIMLVVMMIRRRQIISEGTRNWSVYVWCCLVQCHLVLVGLIAKHFSGRGTGGAGWVILFKDCVRSKSITVTWSANKRRTNRERPTKPVR